MISPLELARIFAWRNRIPLLSEAQLNRQVEQSAQAKPKLSHLRQSPAILSTVPPLAGPSLVESPDLEMGRRLSQTNGELANRRQRQRRARGTITIPAHHIGK
jgi:hypothetical protein